MDEFHCVWRDGSSDWIRWECRPWYTPLNSIGGIIFYSEIITEQKVTEAELIKAKSDAEKLVEKTLHQKTEIELNSNRLESLLRISQYKPKSNQDLLDYALQEAINLSLSKLGYIFYYNEMTRQLDLSAWSKEVMN
jgi:hypothetical protein